MVFPSSSLYLGSGPTQHNLTNTFMCKICNFQRLLIESNSGNWLCCSSCITFFVWNHLRGCVFGTISQSFHQQILMKNDLVNFSIHPFFSYIKPDRNRCYTSAQIMMFPPANSVLFWSILPPTTVSVCNHTEKGQLWPHLTRLYSPSISLGCPNLPQQTSNKLHTCAIRIEAICGLVHCLFFPWKKRI